MIYMTTTATLTDCPICSGTGTDPDFGGTCDCDAWQQPTTINQAIARTLGSAGAPNMNRVAGARNEVDQYAAPVRQGSGYAAPLRTATPATEKQRSFLARLIDERTEWGIDADALTAARACLASSMPLRKQEASKLIDALLSMTRPATAAPAPSQVRPNRYAGACWTCGGHVEAEAGRIEKRDGRWQVFHLDGDDCNAVSEAGDPEPIPAPTVPAGHYAIESTGDNDLAFYRVDAPTEGRWAGRVFVKRVIGGRADENVPRSHIDGILARIAADQDAGPRYGREIGRCCRCNRTLTDETSRALGIGPDCRARD